MAWDRITGRVAGVGRQCGRRVGRRAAGRRAAYCPGSVPSASGVKGWGIQALGLALGLILWAGGCGGPKGEAGGEAGAWSARTAGELIAGHNERVGRIERVWAKAVVEVAWVDGEGKEHFEQGDGNLILRKPNELALTIGKMGHVKFWLGSGGGRYWVFDMTGERRTAYVGKLEGAGAAGAAETGLPAPIRPDRLIELSGLSALEADEAAGAEVERVEGGEAIALAADEASGRGARRLTFDAEGRLIRYATFDEEGRPAVRAALGRYDRLELVDKPTGAYPAMPTRIEVELPGREASMTLYLSRMTNDPDRVRDVQFNFEKLSRANRIDRTVDLDRQGEGGGDRR